MDEFPENNKFTTPGKPPAAIKGGKNVTQIVTTAKTRRPPLGRRIADTFIRGEANSVWKYVLLEVMVPAVKDTIADAMSQGVERMLFGESRGYGRRGFRPPPTSQYSAYQRMYGTAPPQQGMSAFAPQQQQRPSSTIASSRAQDVVLPSRVEAQEVLSALYELLNEYRQVSVADLYALVGFDANHTDHKWGWLDLEGSDIRRISDGYLLIMPRPVVL